MSGTEAPVAIVTAAGRGMGAACARELAHRGYRVAPMSISDAASELAAELGGVGLRGSVTEPADLRALVDSTLERWGRIDAVVNNTGHPPTGELLELTDDEWHAALDLVVLNAVRMARLVTPVMERQGGRSSTSLLSRPTSRARISRCPRRYAPPSAASPSSTPGAMRAQASG